MKTEENIEREGQLTGETGDDIAAEILDALREKNETLTTVESLTAGMISARLADIPGCSDVLKRAYVTYCDQAKHEMVGVKDLTLEKYTAVSAQTAQEMAQGGARAAKADACVSATGYAGPAAGPQDDSAGLVFLGCYYHGRTEVERHLYSGGRNEVRQMAMNDALRLLLRMVSG